MKLLIILSLFVSHLSSAYADIYSDQKYTNVIIENLNGLTGNVVKYTSSCAIRTMVKENADSIYIYEVISDCADLSAVPFARTILLKIDGQHILQGNEIVGSKIGNEYNIRVNFQEEHNKSLNRYLQDYVALCPFSIPPEIELFSDLKSYYELKMTKDDAGLYSLKQSWSSDMVQVSFQKEYKSTRCLFRPVFRVGKQTITLEKLVVESVK